MIVNNVRRGSSNYRTNFASAAISLWCGRASSRVSSLSLEASDSGELASEAPRFGAWRTGLALVRLRGISMGFGDAF